MNKAVLIIVTLGMLLVLTTGLFAAENMLKATPDLTNALVNLSGSDEKIPVYIVLKDAYDANELYNELKDLPRQLRRTETVRRLTEFSDRTQANLRNRLEELEKEGLVTNLGFIWITNIISLEASIEALSILDQFEEIAVIDHDPWEYLLMNDPEDNRESRRDEERQEFNEPTRNPTANVTRIRAPQVWNQGYRGEGVVVAVLDTGVNYNHRDLAQRMWTHPDYPNHGWNFVSNNNNPLDDQGHGTHCAGTVAGDGTAGTLTGVAPESQIMALKVLSSAGQGNVGATVQGIQFAVANGADVLSVSLGWRNASTSDRSTIRTTLVNTLTAGVVAAIAVGNEGRNPNIPNNVRTPGNCPPPWLNPDQTLTGGVSAVISIGATDNNDRIANFSSRGPVSWSNVAPFNDYAYSPGMGLIAPDIVAPGVNINSLRHNNNSGYTTNSGTSMAAPAAAGVMALMIAKDPAITPEEISQIVEETSVARPDTKNGVFGAGRIDALNAIEAVVGTNPPNQAVRPNPEEGTQFIGSRPLLQWSNGGGARSYNVYVGTDNPPTNAVNGAATNDRSYQITTDLLPQETYYWRIDAVNENGVRTGSVWSFETSAPHSVSNPEPADNADDIRMQPLLRWIEEGGADRYAVYLGTDNPPTNVLNGVMAEQTSYQLTEDLVTETLHYWRVDAINDNGATASEVWIFTTGLPAGEGFETGDFSAYSWELSYTGNTEAYWFIDDQQTYSGNFSARSGAIGNSSSTTIAITLELYEPGSISFARKVSSLTGADHLTFFIDSEAVDQWSGEVEWDELTYQVQPGTRTFRWVYSKNHAGSAGSDAAWIDHITFPALGVPSPEINPPADVASTMKLDHINLSWSFPEERPVILGYNIYRSDNSDDDFQKINNTPYRGNSYRDQLVAEGTYYYYVTSVYESGESEPSEQVSATVYEAIASPVFSHEAGEYNEPLEISIDVEEDDAVVYYTIDGTDPTSESILYEQAIEINESTIVKARSFKLNHLPGEIVEAEYIIALAVEDDVNLNEGARLSVYPNPLFIGSKSANMNIAFSMKENREVQVDIFNIIGQRIRTININEAVSAQRVISWDLQDNQGRQVGTGIYLINVQSGNERVTKRLMIVN